MCVDSIRFSKQVFLPLDSVAGRMRVPESKDKTEDFPNVFWYLAHTFDSAFNLIKPTI